MLGVDIMDGMSYCQRRTRYCCICCLFYSKGHVRYDITLVLNIGMSGCKDYIKEDWLMVLQ